MNTSLGYAKKTLTNSNVLLSGGGDKALSEFIGSLNWDSTNKKLQYKSASSTDFTDLITFGSNAFTSYTVDNFLLKSGGLMTGPLTWKDNAALPLRNSVENILTVDAFTSGGTMGWASLDTLKSSIGLENYVTLDTALTITGSKKFSGTGDFILTIDKNNGSNAWIAFANNGTILGGIGVTNDRNVVFSDRSSIYTIWHSGNTIPYATNADTVDGYHASELFKAASTKISNGNSSNTWIRIATINIPGTGLGIANISAIFSNREVLDNTSFILTLAIRRNDTTSAANIEFYYNAIQSTVPRTITVRSDDNQNFYVYIQTVANTWTTYYYVTNLITEGNVTFENVGTTSPISGSITNVDASKGGNVLYASSAGSVNWSNVSSKPETATRWPSWLEVTDKPDTFTPSYHTHDYLPLSGGTMTGGIVMGTDHYIYGVQEANGSMLHFDGNRTVIGSCGATSTLATHLRSKTGHLTCGTDNTASYTIWDSGNDGSGSGLDADKLDGLDSNEFPILSIKGTEFESGGTCDVTEVGTYYSPSSNRSASLTNTPHTSSNFKLWHIATGLSNYPVLIAIAYDEKVYFRGNANGTWRDWKRFAFTDSNITGNAANVTGTVEITHGGTGATTRLDALKALTNENVSTNAQYFLTVTSLWANGGYTSVADAKTILAMTGATNTTAGTAGVVPAPLSDGYDTKFLGADGTWKVPDYPTKNSWNYDDCYVSSLTINNDYLIWTKNGATNDLTIPYATKAAQDSNGRSLVTYKEYSGTFPPNDGTLQWYTLLTYINNYYTKSAIIEINTRRGTAIILILFHNYNTPFITILGYYGSPTATYGGFTGGIRIIDDGNNAKILFLFYTPTSTSAYYRRLGIKVYSEIPASWELVDSLVADTTIYESFLADVKAKSKCLTGGGLMPTANNTYDIGSSSFKYNDVYATRFNGTLQGNANTATKLATARDISLIGDATGSTTFDGSADVSISVSINNMTGATASEAGTAGFVPAPPSDGYNTKFLRADGTWSVPAASIENVASATKLQTARTLWGLSFDGTANVSGNMTDVGTISASGNNTITKTSGDAIFAAVNNNGSVELITATNRGIYDRTNMRWLIGTDGTNSWLDCGNVGIGTSSPSYKLHVNGAFYASGNSSIGGTFGVNGATTLSSTLGVSGLLTASGGVTIPSGKNLKIGNAEFYWDSTSQGIKITKPLSDYNPTSNFKTINGNSIIGTGDITIEGGGATKLYTSHLLTKRDLWFRFANLTLFGASYLVSIRDNYYNNSPTPVTWIINVGYSSATITLIGKVVLTPTSLTKLRIVRYSNNSDYGFHLEVYTPYQSYISRNTPEISIMNLGRNNMTDGIELVHDLYDNTKWLEVNENIQSSELLIEETDIPKTTTLWGQSFDGASNVSGSLLGVTSIEMNSDGALSGFGGFIDFHYNGSSADYTSRIIEDANGRLSINGVLYAQYGGNVGIGAAPSSSYKLYVNGNTQATNFYTTSDRNKKKNISEFSEHIRKFQLKGTEKWNYGVIAQEVEEMFREGKDGNMTVNYDSILSYYIGLLENKVKALEEKIRILETKNK